MNKILVVDDHRLIFDGIAAHLAGKYELAFAASVEEAQRLLKYTKYYAAVIDIKIGERSGLECLPLLPRETSAFMLSMHKSLFYIRKAKNLGAKGYFLKDESLDLLFQALANPASRPFWLSPSVAAEELEPVPGQTDSFESLSSREQQIFLLLADGLNYKTIADRLSISPKTVNVHRDNLMLKLGLETQTDIIKKALEWGFSIV